MECWNYCALCFSCQRQIQKSHYYRKGSSLQLYVMASSCHCCAITDYSHSFPEIVGICTRVHLWVPVESNSQPTSQPASQPASQSASLPASQSVSQSVKFLARERNNVKTFFNYIIKIEIKTAAAGLKNELKYSPLSDGSTCISEPNLEILLLRIIQ